MLDEDIQSILDLENGWLRRISQHLFHVSHVWVQALRRAKLLIVRWKLKVKRPISLSLFLTACKLLLFQVFLPLDRWNSSDRASELSWKFDFERLDSFLALTVVHEHVHSGFLTRWKSQHVECDSSFCLWGAEASNASNLDGKVLTQLRSGRFLLICGLAEVESHIRSQKRNLFSLIGPLRRSILSWLHLSFQEERSWECNATFNLE